MLKRHDIHGIAHITGGGITDNLPRVLPDGIQAKVKRHSWERPAIFAWLQQNGNVSEEEMLRTFNCGIGLILVVAAQDKDDILTTCRLDHVPAWVIGEITTTEAAEPHVTYVD